MPLGFHADYQLQDCRGDHQPGAEQVAEEDIATLAGCELVFTMVTGPADLEEVTLGEGGLLTGERRPGVLVDCSTVSAESSVDAFDILGLNAPFDISVAAARNYLDRDAQAYVTGYCICCPEAAETVMTDMREIGPTYYFAPPRVLENLLTQVSIRMEDASRIKRWLYGYFMGIANRVGGAILDRKHVSLLDRLLYAIGDLVVYGPLRNVLGMSRVKVGYTAGEAIGPDLFRFYRSIGINLKQLYGSTETAVFVCIQPDGQVKPDTVGPAVPGVELKFTPERELVVRGPGLFREYYKNAQATAEVKDSDGWFHTGDAGYFDADGHVKIIDRVKDVGSLADSTLFAPKYLENKLKFFPYIREAVCFGHGRERVCAFINIDPEAVGNWAEKRNMPYSGYTDLASRPEVYDLVRECIERVNADLAAEPEIANSQIHRFLILHKELDADDGELTRTRKVRRRYIAEKYASLVEALYAGGDAVHVEAQVKYEDGRTGTYAGDLRIDNARTFAPAAAERAA